MKKRRQKKEKRSREEKKSGVFTLRIGGVVLGIRHVTPKHARRLPRDNVLAISTLSGKVNTQVQAALK